ncbi:MAG TPA: hypothetical protein VM659_02550 [Dongiaceae bacterium]|nr:hypothetical protein [Dongiaceae bacterium]
MQQHPFLRQAFALLIVASCLSALVSSRARAVDLTDQGLDFSDERGGFRLVSVTGTGTVADPITVTEEVTGPNDPILIIRGFSAAFGNRIASFHTAAFAMRKIVINRTDKTWRSYRVELREVETRHSDYSDGLSFGQSASVSDDFTGSSVFASAQRINEPEDSITFSNGVVPPGGKAVIQFVVSDMSPIHQFYLFQEPAEPISQLETPPAPTRSAAADQREAGRNLMLPRSGADAPLQ